MGDFILDFIKKSMSPFKLTPTVILLWTPFALTIIEYFFIPSKVWKLFSWAKYPLPGSQNALNVYLWWASGTILLTVVFPIFFLKFFLKTPLSQVGFSTKNLNLKNGAIYFYLYLLILPVIFIVSLRPDFQNTYPFFRCENSEICSRFFVFQAAYFLQFLAVEFFFRGFMVLGLKPTLGPYSILVMLAPYCMIHYHKPFLETLGAIIAGLVLGVLSYQTETIVYGWLLHYAVALTLDLLALKFV